jgi:potassium inwardly-rectifying channel subfamily J, other
MVGVVFGESQSHWNFPPDLLITRNRSLLTAKLSRPKKRAQTLLFSRNAVICHRDGVPCLMFRVGDMRKSHIIEAHVRAQIIKRKVSKDDKKLRVNSPYIQAIRFLMYNFEGQNIYSCHRSAKIHFFLYQVTKEGELLPFFQQELEVGADGSDDRLMFIWPTLIVHKIDEDSPLYEISAQDLIKERFEIVTMLEGVVESTGMTTQARSSYLPSEILWGHRFESTVQFKRETGEYEVI